jgi:hypothetical protein
LLSAAKPRAATKLSPYTSQHVGDPTPATTLKTPAGVNLKTELPSRNRRLKKSKLSDPPTEAKK